MSQLLKYEESQTANDTRATSALEVLRRSTFDIRNETHSQRNDVKKATPTERSEVIESSASATINKERKTQPSSVIVDTKILWTCHLLRDQSLQLLFRKLLIRIIHENFISSSEVEMAISLPKDIDDIQIVCRLCQLSFLKSYGDLPTLDQRLLRYYLPAIICDVVYHEDLIQFIKFPDHEESMKSFILGIYEGIRKDSAKI